MKKKNRKNKKHDAAGKLDSLKGYKHFFDYAIDGFFVSNREGIYIDANKHGCRMLGYARDEIIGKHFLDLVAEESKDAAKKGYKNLRKKGMARGERVFLKKGGAKVYVDLNAKQFKVGNQHHYISMMRDISQRKKYEQELEKQNKKLSTLYDVSTITSSTLDLEKVLSLIIHHVVKSFDIDLCTIRLLDENNELLIPEMYYAPSSKYIRMEPLPYKECLLGWVMRNKKKYHYVKNIKKEKRFLDQELARKGNFTSLFSVPLSIKGEPIGIINLLTKRKKVYSQAEVDLLVTLANQVAMIIRNNQLHERIKQENKSLSVLLTIDNILASAQETDKALKLILDKTVKFTNSDGGSLLLVEDDLFNLKFSKGYKIKDRRAKAGLRGGIIKAAVKNKKTINVPDTSKDPRYVKLVIPSKSEVAIPLKVKGKVIGVLDLESRKLDNYSKFNPYLNLLTKHISMVIDNARLVDEINEFNERLQDEVYQATKELRVKNLELQRLDQLKSDFVSSVSHELRTPLTSIAGYAKVLHKGNQGELTVDQKDSLNIIIEESERLTRLINDVLDLSKLETGRIRFKLEKVDLYERAKQCVDAMIAPAKERKIKLTVSGSKSLPLIPGNHDLIGQIFMNLLSNALKFTDPGGSIDITVKKKGDYVRTIVKDTGCGIPEDVLPKLFNKFYQADMTMTRKHGGTGLGLPIVKHIVNIHKGTVKVESEVGKGSTFIIDFPVKR